jgi:hypothetical protein
MSIELTSPVAAAVEPSRAAAVQRARAFAQSLAEVTLQRFAADPTLAHRPSLAKFPGRQEHRARKSLYDRVIELISAVPGTCGKERQADPARVAAFVERAGESASAQFTAFVQKLEGKVGACLTAVLTSEHVWDHSLLVVTKEGGVTETWKTQQIINVSSLGRPFNQWPTRKLKGRVQ